MRRPGKPADECDALAAARDRGLMVTRQDNRESLWSRLALVLRIAANEDALLGCFSFGERAGERRLGGARGFQLLPFVLEPRQARAGSVAERLVAIPFRQSAGSLRRRDFGVEAIVNRLKFLRGRGAVCRRPTHAPH